MCLSGGFLSGGLGMSDKLLLGSSSEVRGRAPVRFLQLRIWIARNPHF